MPLHVTSWAVPVREEFMCRHISKKEGHGGRYGREQQFADLKAGNLIAKHRSFSTAIVVNSPVVDSGPQVCNVIGSLLTVWF